MSFRGLLNTTVDVKREVETADGQGGYTTAWTIILRRIPFRFESLSGRQVQDAYSKLQPRPDFLGYCEYQSGIKERDRIVDSKGKLYAVQLVENWSLENKYTKLAMTEIARGE